MFHILITLLLTIIMGLMQQAKKTLARNTRRQQVVTVILLEMARPDAELRQRLAPEFAKLIEMNGD